VIREFAKTRYILLSQQLCGMQNNSLADVENCSVGLSLVSVGNKLQEWACEVDHCPSASNYKQ
jgi:hypothetical protein